MLRPAKFLTVLLASCFLFFTCLLLVSSPPSNNSLYTSRGRGRTRSSLLSFTGSDGGASGDNSADCLPANISPTKVARRLQQSSVDPTLSEPSAASTSSHRERSGDGQDRELDNVKSTPSSPPIVGKQVAVGEPRYLMYVPYAGVTNQLISIWHASLIAKALNRTLLIPNLSPNVHVEPTKEGGQPKQEPALTKWSEFFDLDTYSKETGLQIEELDTFLARRGVVERDSLADLAPFKRRKRSLQSDDGKAVSNNKRRGGHKKRWIQLVQEGHQISGAGASGSDGSGSRSDSFSFVDATLSETSNAKGSADGMVRRTIKFPAVQKCFAEAGYGADRRIDMTGRRFMERYGIDSELIPTPFLDPERDNATIWARWRMDKVIERYQQPAYENEEVLCLGHVYRLLPGGNNRAWVEFGQHFHFTERVDSFVDEILRELLPPSKLETQDNISVSPPPFVGIHLRRGDFYRHCLGITSPSDPNGWNRCYPSTAHIISLLSKLSNVPLTLPPTEPLSASSLLTQQQRLQHEEQQKTPLQELPVLVLTNEHDPEELAKADQQNWIRVDHHRLGTLERFGRYGPILIDGALLARSSLLVGVEYSTYFKTASKRAETWYGGNTLFVT